jgi:hypothetical protein
LLPIEPQRVERHEGRSVTMAMDRQRKTPAGRSGQRARPRHQLPVEHGPEPSQAAHTGHGGGDVPASPRAQRGLSVDQSPGPPAIQLGFSRPALHRPGHACTNQDRRDVRRHPASMPSCSQRRPPVRR